MNGNSIPCHNCGDILSGDEIYFVVDNDNEYCGGCVEECGYCGEWFADLDYHREYGCGDCGRSICPDSSYFVCHNCGDYFCEDCGDCRYCRRPNAVRGYHDNPDYISYGHGDYTMGVEIEYNGDTHSIMTAVHQFDDCEEYVWACDDGSLYGGAEIISHPMTLEFFRTGFPFGRMMQAIRNTGDAEVTDGTGIHVHIDRRAFRKNGRHNQTHAYRWIKFVLSNRDGCEIIGRRNSREYAEFVLPGEYGYNGYSEVLRVKSAQHRTSDNRYTAVNTTKAATYELRFFKSSYRERDLMAAVEFAHSSVEYARDGMNGIPVTEAFRWASFTSWLATRATDYPVLAAALHVLSPGDQDGRTAVAVTDSTNCK